MMTDDNNDDVFSERGWIECLYIFIRVTPTVIIPKKIGAPSAYPFIIVWLEKGKSETKFLVRSEHQ